MVLFFFSKFRDVLVSTKISVEIEGFFLQILRPACSGGCLRRRGGGGRQIPCPCATGYTSAPVDAIGSASPWAVWKVCLLPLETKVAVTTTISRGFP